jgi:hypothetical protein
MSTIEYLKLCIPLQVAATLLLSQLGQRISGAERGGLLRLVEGARQNNLRHILLPTLKTKIE